MAGRNEIEILITAHDQASKALAQVGAEINKLSGGVSGASDALGGLQEKTQGALGRIMDFAVGMTAANLATMALGKAWEYTVGAMQKGIESIDSLKMAQASLAAAASTNDPSQSFDRMYEVSGKMVEKVYQLDRAFIGTGDELLMLADSMVTYGMGLDLSTEKAEKQFVAFGNLLKMVTRDQGFQRQAFQEVRALMEGMDVPGAMIVKKLEAAGVNVKAMIPLWREQGTLLENIMSYMSGYKEASGKIEMTLQAQKSSLETITNKILREGMGPAYQEIVGWVKQLNDYLMDENGLTKEGQAIAETLTDVWELVALNLGNVWKAALNLYKALEPIYALSQEIGSSILYGWTGMLAILPVITDRIGELIAGILDAVKMTGNLGAALGHVAVLDFSGAAEHAKSAVKNYDDAGKRAGAAFRKGFLDDLEKNLREVDEKLLRTKGGKSKIEGGILPGGKDKGDNKEALKAAESLAKMIDDLTDKMMVERAKQRVYLTNQAEIDAIMSLGGESAAEIKKAQIDRINRDQKLLEMAVTAKKLPAGVDAETARRTGPEDVVRGLEASMLEYAAAVEKVGDKVTKQKIKDLMGKDEIAALDSFFTASDKDIKEGEKVRLDIEKHKEAVQELLDKYQEMERYSSEMKPRIWDVDGIKDQEKALHDLELEMNKIDALERKYAEGLEGGTNPEQTAKLREAAGRVYQAKLGQIADANDRTAARIEQLWADTFSAINDSFQNVFLDGMRGKFKSLTDYMDMFTDQIRQVWSKMLAGMLTDWLENQAKMSFAPGGGGQSGLNTLLGWGTKAIGMFSGGGTVAGYDGGLASMAEWAEGGVVPGSFIPIRAFAAGGIATRPTLGMIGEGGDHEAVIPLKGGAVPVRMSGKKEGTVNQVTNVSFNITAADTKDFDRLLMERRLMISGMIRGELQNAGGMRDSIRRNTF